MNLSTLRAVVRDHPVGRHAASSSEREIISVVARWLANGELRLVRAPMLAFVYGWDKDGEQALAALQAAAPAKMFSLQIVDDASDDTMGDLELIVKLPDGTEQKTRTDASGRIDLSCNKAGTADVSTAIEGVTAAKTLVFVKLGALPPQGQAAGVKGPKGSGWFVASRVAMV